MRVVNHPSPAPHADHLIVVSRFRVPADERANFLDRADDALVALTDQPGCLAASLGQATDDPELLLLRTEWPGVGAYRRAMSAFDVKVRAVPLLSTAIDEPSAYEVVRNWDGHAIVRSRTGLAADAGDVSLGSASGPDIDPVRS